ncbi:hypothetical protein PIB30_046396 [Stylosanthes scabra]|uniref:C2 domain-containing protein n=1 Tax=Stylosanthes scabra TaxID=79078 RepID=A0ABU6RGI2_9FABA|nr:hypothetical protein [Stylosanthes scabra]
MSNILPPYQLLELNVISAQDLAPVGRSMRCYAVAWIDPDRKLSTQVDAENGVNPTWNDKFVFRVDEDFLYDEDAVITIDIYAIHWFKDIHVGTAHVIAAEHIPPPTTHPPHKNAGMQFIGLQVHRPSGRPKGILNVGVAVLDGTMRSMPLYSTTPIKYHDDMDIDQLSLQPDAAKRKPELRRTKSDTSSMIGPEAVAHEKRAKAKKGKASSVVTASEVSRKSNSKKKASSTLSAGSDGRPKSIRKGKIEKVKKASKLLRSPEPNTSNNYKEILGHGTPLRKDVIGFEVNQSPNPQYWNSPAMAYNTPGRGGVRATPMHSYAAMNAAMEYGTPYRSDLGRPMMTNSELGPSASEVAAAVARQPVDEGDGSTVGGWSLDAESVEGLQPRVDRWRTELPTVYDGGDMASTNYAKSSNRKDSHSRRHTDGDDEGLFSCFSVICGVECSIVCGGDRKKKKNRRRRAQSADGASYVS